MPEPTPDQVLIATIAWLAAARREWVRRNPGRDDCPVLTFEQLTIHDRSSFLRITKETLIAADSKSASIQAALLRNAQ